MFIQMEQFFEFNRAFEEWFREYLDNLFAKLIQFVADFKRVFWLLGA